MGSETVLYHLKRIFYKGKVRIGRHYLVAESGKAQCHIHCSGFHSIEFIHK